jgi:sec-independent protein translocase protein TatA
MPCHSTERQQWGISCADAIVQKPFLVQTRVVQSRAMGKIGIPELLIILAIVVLIFGANKLPELGRGIGRGIKNFKDATKDGTEEKS